MRMIALLASGLLAGCATMPDGAEPDATDAPASVDFAVTPCFGSCPDFAITLSADGKGRYEGRRFVAVKGVRDFTASPAQVRAFFDRIRPFRPEGKASYDYEHCSVPVRTDSPSVHVAWHGADREDALDWYLGCPEPRLLELKPDLYNAWKELPLGDLVGTAENRFGYEGQGG